MFCLHADFTQLYGHAHTQHLALEGDQAVLPALLVLTVAAQRAVPVQELEVALQYCLDLHLPLCGAAGMQEVYDGSQALQGQPWEPRGLGFGGHLAAPRSQDREEVLNRVRSYRKKAVFLRAEKKTQNYLVYLLSVEWSQNSQRSVRKRRARTETFPPLITAPWRWTSLSVRNDGIFWLSWRHSVESKSHIYAPHIFYIKPKPQQHRTSFHL